MRGLVFQALSVILILTLPITCLSSIPCIISNLNISINLFLANKSCSEFVISNGIFVLKKWNTANIFTNRSYFKLTGTKDTTIECKQHAGLAFKFVSNIKIQNITFRNCGMIFNSTSNYPSATNTTTLTSKAALLFEYCKNINLTSITVNNSDGVGIQMYNTIGKISISHSIFSGNKIKESHAISGGGGIYIEFSLCEPGTHGINCKFTDPNFATKATYEISFSKFIRNIGSTTDPGRTGNIHSGYHKHYAFGRGGGMAVQFLGNASYNNFKITHCTFEDNIAQYGAGMHVVFQDSCHNNIFNVKDSQFFSNKLIAKRLDYVGTTGGGIKLTFAIYNNKDNLSYNKATFKNVTFEANSAFIGGGFSFRTSKEQNVISPTNLLHFIGCHWIANKARLGAAIDLSIIHVYENGQQLKPYFTNCTFINNTVTGFTMHNRNDAYGITDNNSTNISGGYWPGSGIMYLNAVTVHFVSIIMFANNTGGAIVIIDAGIIINPKATVNFTGNHAELGGALYLSGNSWISVSPHVQVSFIDNSADKSGGAIYHQKHSEHDLASSVNCFIRYSDVSVGPYHWNNVSLLFLDNCVSTDYGGDAIYTTTVVDCAWNESFSSGNNTTLKQMFMDWPSFEFSNSHYNRCDDFIQTSARYFNFEMITALKIAPGQSFKFPFKALNDFNDPTFTTFIIHSNEKQVSIPNRIVQTSDSTLLRIRQKVNSSFYLQFETINNRKHIGYITVTVEKCPLGYILNYDVCECIAVNKYEGLAYCSSTELEIYIQPGYWAGYVGKGKVFSTYTCPISYCIETSTPIALSYDSNVLCKNRTGILCGECKPGYGLSVGTLDCVNCTGSYLIAWVILITTTYVPITIVFVALLVLNVNLAVGPIHSFIFFCQVFPAISLDNNHWGDYSSAITIISNIHSAIINIMSLRFNMYFTTKYCLSNSMNNMDYYLLQYASALYPLVILVIIVSIIRYCPGCVVAKYIWHLIRCCVTVVRKRTSMQQTIVHGLIGFLLLTYANFVNISFQILKYAYFEDSTGIVLVPFRQGTMHYFDKHHLPYALIAVVFLLTFGIIPPIILIFYPVILSIIGYFGWDDTTKVRTLRKRISLYKLMPIFDAFWSELKPGCRVFAGFYFLYQLLVFSLFSLAPAIYQIYFGISILFIFIMFLHAFVQPYKKESYNNADFFMFATIGIINSFYAHSEFLRAENVSLSAIQTFIWIQTILAWAPIFYVVCYIIFKIRKPQQHNYNQLHNQQTNNGGDNVNNDGPLY